MKYIIRKPFWNYEKEEEWINEMCAKGLALTDYSWCRYVFEDCDNGEYIYRIELLNKPAAHPESMKYIQFLEETGVEHVASYMRWIYCRKKASEGEFNLFTDINSKLKHFKEVRAFWLTITMVEFCIGIPNIIIGITNSITMPITNANTILGSLCLVLGVVLFFVGMPSRRKVRLLKKEKAIME